jgi:hypothetical protein
VAALGTRRRRSSSKWPWPRCPDAGASDDCSYLSSGPRSRPTSFRSPTPGTARALARRSSSGRVIPSRSSTIVTCQGFEPRAGQGPGRQLRTRLSPAHGHHQGRGLVAGSREGSTPPSSS